MTIATHIRSLTAFALALVVLLTGAGAAHAESDSTPVTVPVPAPGHSSTWTMPIENASSDDAAIWVTATGESDALPLLIEFTDADGRTLIASTPIAELTETAINLGELPAGTSTVVHGRATLPRDVGNEAQGVSQTTTFEFSLMSTGETENAVPDDLAQTGFMLAWLIPLAFTLILLGMMIGWRRKKSRYRDDGTMPEGSPSP